MRNGQYDIVIQEHTEAGRLGCHWKLGRAYTRHEIFSELGGGTQDYLPHHDGRVVCACLKKSMDPGAPDTILVGNPVNVVRYARVFSRQQNFIPVFIKQDVNKWLYVGDYRVQYVLEDDAEVNRLAQEAQRSDVVMVLKLRRRD